MAIHRLPSPHVPHLRLEMDEHPWRALPIMLGVIVVLATVLIVASFEIAKAVTGHAY